MTQNINICFDRDALNVFGFFSFLKITVTFVLSKTFFSWKKKKSLSALWRINYDVTKWPQKTSLALQYCLFSYVLVTYGQIFMPIPIYLWYTNVSFQSHSYFNNFWCIYLGCSVFLQPLWSRDLWMVDYFSFLTNLYIFLMNSNAYFSLFCQRHWIMNSWVNILEKRDKKVQAGD